MDLFSIIDKNKGNNLNVFTEKYFSPSKCLYRYIFKEDREVMLHLNQYRRFEAHQELSPYFKVQTFRT
jgi:hypothetical protein